MIFFTSDLHISHKNILKYQPNRPWKSIQEMNEGIISNWNSTIGPTDEVYILGDFAFAQPSIQIAILKRLNGKKYFVSGNHDDMTSEELQNEFVWIKDFYELNHTFPDGVKQKIVMCHYALRMWNKSHRGAWNVYGHSHGSLPPVGKQLDVGIDATIKYSKWFGSNAGVKPFCPVSMVQVRTLLDTQEIFYGDHHQPKEQR